MVVALTVLAAVLDALVVIALAALNTNDPDKKITNNLGPRLSQRTLQVGPYRGARM